VAPQIAGAAKQTVVDWINSPDSERRAPRPHPHATSRPPTNTKDATEGPGDFCLSAEGEKLSPVSSGSKILEIADS